MLRLNRIHRLTLIALALASLTTPAAHAEPVAADAVLDVPEAALADEGAAVDLSEDAAAAARTAVLNALAAASDVVGGIDRIGRIVKVVVYVASAPDFTGQPLVANGASELLGDVFGDAGAHARSAVGVAALPLGAPVEIELTIEARPA